MSHDVQETKDRLLAAAREEFAEFGIAGARVDRIGRRAGVNKERIYGHFGNKEGLFHAVVAEALGELARAVPLDEADPVAFVGGLYDFHRANPVLLRLFLWEALHFRGQSPPNEQERASSYGAKIEQLAKALDVEPSEDVARLLLTLIGLAAWPSAVPHLARLITGATVESQGFAREMREQVVEFAAGALAHARNLRQVPAEGAVE